MIRKQPGLPPGFLMAPHHLWAFVYHPRRYYIWLHQKYGEIVTLIAPHSPLVMTLTSEGARRVLTASPDDYDVFQKQAFRGLAGDGSLFVMMGEQHRTERQLLMPAFHKQYVHHYGQVIQDIVVEQTNKWYPGQEFRGLEAMLAISRDVILKVVFGDDFEDLKEEGREALSRMLDAAHPMIEFVPQFQSFWFPPWVRFRKVKSAFTRFAAKSLARRRERGTISMDVLGMLIEGENEDGSPKTDTQILDELYTILMPGHATTGVALAWALYELGRHPAVLNWLREEMGVLGPDPDPAEMAMQPYLSAVCDETMRLHTIVTETARLTLSPRKLLGYTIPEGVGVGVGIIAIHHDPSLYPEPDNFKPERFLERNYNSFEFLPFGGGHRRCLGTALSDFEMHVTLATIVSRWELEVIGEEREVRHHLALGPKYGVRLRVKGQRKTIEG